MANLSESKKRKAVAYWLLIGVFMIIVQIIIGGVTRLTGSGLSITEWKPILGVIPPLNENDWMEAFDNYKQIAQYSVVNPHFSLSDFKFIYFWEWFHRVWARGLGVVFAIPFVYFLVKKFFTKSMILPLLLLFALGGAQGLVGWIMVKSGLNDTNTYVSHIRLAIHFVSALVLLVYTFWFALKLLVPETKKVHFPQVHRILLVTIIVLVIQLFYGPFMAGLHAGASAPTWPDINGQFMPPTFPSESWIDNRLNVQFIHRTLAYMLFFLVIWPIFPVIRMAKKESNVSTLKRSIYWTILFIALQITLGIIAVLISPTIAKGHFGKFEFIAELHQIVALFLLLSLVFSFFLVTRTSKG